jgi:hypothetical protein
LLKINNMFCP